MSSGKKNKRVKAIIFGAVAVFIIGIVAGVGVMTLYSRFKSIKANKPEEKVEETKIIEEILEETSDSNVVATLQPDTALIVDGDDEDLDGDSEISGNIDVYFKSCDWGTQLLRVLLKLDAPIDRADIDDWEVIEHKHGCEDDDSEKKVTDAFLCNASGERIEEPSQYIVLELYTAPEEMSPFCWNSKENHYEYPEDWMEEDGGYTVSVHMKDECEDLTSKGITVEDVEINKHPQKYYTGVDGFTQDQFESSDGIEYTYAHYEAENSDTMVVFLHGLSEGGERADALLTAMQTNAAMFISDEFQDTMGGASILIPHCPTYWMNQSPTYDSLEWAMYNPYIQSWYTQSLHELIADYKEQCGAKRVIIVGHSNGGFMTLLLGLYYENEYDGYVMLSEAMWDKSITDEHITNLAKLPLYFVYCNNDQAASPVEYSAPTIRRIKEKRPKDLHVATFDSVNDLTGTYFNGDGSPYTFDAHQSNIYFFRNNVKCNDCGKSVWDWMAKVGR